MYQSCQFWAVMSAAAAALTAIFAKIGVENISPRRDPTPLSGLIVRTLVAVRLHSTTSRGRLSHSCYPLCDEMNIGRDDGCRESGYNAPPRSVSAGIRVIAAPGPSSQAGQRQARLVAHKGAGQEKPNCSLPTS